MLLVFFPRGEMGRGILGFIWDAVVIIFLVAVGKQGDSVVFTLCFCFFVLLGLIIFFWGGGISNAVVFCIFLFFCNLSGHDYFSKSFTKTHVVVGIYIKINHCIYKSLKRGGGNNRIMFVPTPTIFWYHVYSSFDFIFLCINKHTPPYQLSVSLC